ncbi:MAG TPA: hypothetical protein VFQ61_11975 [Polyangiaceae bacterium]|nr:hypothetical protein [Polyangiaceae bacterium]
MAKDDKKNEKVKVVIDIEDLRDIASESAEREDLAGKGAGARASAQIKQAGDTIMCPW